MAIIFTIVNMILVVVISVHITESIEEKDLPISPLPNAMHQAERRWSIFYVFEKSCVRKCRKYGISYGRLLGTVCQCLCPQEKATSTCDPATNISCNAYCKFKGFKRGGDCYTDTDCFCFTRPRKNICPRGRRPIIHLPEFLPEFVNSGIMTAISNLP